jgi:hypothetical protein
MRGEKMRGDKRRTGAVRRVCLLLARCAGLALLSALVTACQSAVVPPRVSTSTRAPVSVTATVQAQWALLLQRRCICPRSPQEPPALGHRATT